MTSGTFANRWLRRGALALLAAATAAILAACGSDDDKPSLNRLVTFGDSATDIGTYTVGTIAAVGGGKFTTNPGPVSTELLAKRLNYAITPAVMGFDGVSTECPMPPNCTAWAMGGARITLTPGVRQNPDGTGQLAVPVKQQIQRHLARFGNFRGDDLVFVQGGYNDVFYQLGVLQAAVGAGVPADQAAANAVAALATAGAELAGYVKNDILGRGAQYVVVQLAQDLSVSPFGVRLGPQTQALITAMTDAFNQQLAAGLAGTNAKVNDIRAVYRQWHLNPAANGFANTTTEACDKAKIAAATGGAVTDGPSLLCSKATLIDADTSRHLYADDVHPSAYGHQRLGELVEQFIESIGWL